MINWCGCRLGVTTNVAWYFYAQPGLWDPAVWLNEYDTLHLLVGHRRHIDPRYHEAEAETANIKTAHKCLASKVDRKKYCYCTSDDRRPLLFLTI